MNRVWRRRFVRAYKTGKSGVPPGLRSALGVVLIAGGLLGILPVLGFWMIPLGIFFIALDVPPLRRRIRRKLVNLRTRR